MQLECRKLKNLWKLKNTELNNNRVKEDIKKEFKIFLELDKIESITYQNLWPTMKATSLLDNGT